MGDFLVFQLDGHAYALEVACIVEIVRAATPTPLPHAPAIVLGALNVRGALVPVLDIRRRFHLTPRSLRPSDCFIVVQAGSRRVAVAVEAARQLLEIDPSAIEAASAISPGVEHVAGVARLADGLVVVFDFAAFLAESEGLSLDDALRKAETA